MSLIARVSSIRPNVFAVADLFRTCSLSVNHRYRLIKRCTPAGHGEARHDGLNFLIKPYSDYAALRQG